MSQVTLRFLRFHCLDRHHCAVQYHHLVDGIIRRFEESNPQVRVESVIMRNWYQLTNTVYKQLPTDDTPDIFHTCGGGLLEDLAMRGLVQDLTPDLDGSWRQEFVPAALCPLSFGGRVYAVPLEQGLIFVWYNKRIFARLGLSVPRTFADLLEVCRALRRSSLVPFTLGNQERWPGAFFFSHLFHRIGGEAVFVSDFTRSSNYADIRESFVAAAEKLQELVEAGAFPERGDAMNYQRQRDLFHQGGAAMQLNGNRLLSYILTEAPAMADEVGYFPFPLVENGKGGLTTVFGGSLATYAMSARSKHKAEALLLLKCLTDETAAKEVIFDMGDIPGMNHVPCDRYPSALHGGLAKMLEDSEKVQVHYFKYLPPHPAGVYLNAVAKLITGDMTPLEAFETVEASLASAAAKDTVQT